MEQSEGTGQKQEPRVGSPLGGGENGARLPIQSRKKLGIWDEVRIDESGMPFGDWRSQADGVAE